MHQRLPSLTATLVALVRGVYSTATTGPPAAADPFATPLLPALVRPLVQVLASPRVFPVIRPLLGVPSMGLVDHVALRTLAIDDAVRDAMRAGIAQVVVLGAGLDARAFRMEALREATVFEVDHPATQRYKRSRVVRWRPAAEALHFVAVDFEHHALEQVLADAGHRSDRPTFWLWEGVTVYLEPAAIEATLRALSARSSRGSRVAITYTTPAMVPSGRMLGAALRMVARVIREPIRGLLDRDEMSARVNAVGFTVLSDEATTDWAVRYWSSGDARRVVSRERLMLAAKR